MLDLPIGPAVHVDSGHVVVRAALGFTAYLADPEYWARKGAPRLLEAVLGLPQATLLHVYTTSKLTEWKACSHATRQELRDQWKPQSLTSQRPRHFFSLRLADTANCPAVGFDYTEIDSTRAERSAVIQVTLPMMSDPDQLLDLALLAAECGPLHSLVGGYVARWNWLHASLAFHRFHQWASRYWGLDVQESEEWAWHTPNALPGANWITVVGDELNCPIDRDALEAKEWQGNVSSLRLTHGLAVRAGERPSLGDVNQLTYPAEMAEVARELAPFFIGEPPQFWGPFYRDESTRDWLFRLVEPEGWSRYELPTMKLDTD